MRNGVHDRRCAMPTPCARTEDGPRAWRRGDRGHPRSTENIAGSIDRRARSDSPNWRGPITADGGGHAGVPNREDQDRAASAARGVRAARTPGQRRVELPRRVHASRRSLRAVPPGRIRARTHSGRRTGTTPAGPGRWTGCAPGGTAPGARPKDGRRSSKRRWVRWSRPSVSCPRASRRSRRGSLPRTGRWRGRRGSSKRGELGEQLAGPAWRRTSWRARRAARSCTRTVVTAICCTCWLSAARRRTGSSRAARSPCGHWSTATT